MTKVMSTYGVGQHSYTITFLVPGKPERASTVKGDR